MCGCHDPRVFGHQCTGWSAPWWNGRLVSDRAGLSAWECRGLMEARVLW